ncbi:hypothetical protein PR048_024707 [Dryococelus australis]|uniref:Uncharacterized protein n=1 Tax=Dryococelus australis TaxID=614101 RepID=A0ABQ9GPA1_9NEOP|nr:hypothetical protein PR048_024707 [Dryococelus australis]
MKQMLFRRCKTSKQSEKTPPNYTARFFNTEGEARGRSSSVVEYKGGGKGTPRINPQAKGHVRHVCHMRKSGLPHVTYCWEASRPTLHFRGALFVVDRLVDRVISSRAVNGEQITAVLDRLNVPRVSLSIAVESLRLEGKVVPARFLGSRHSISEAGIPLDESFVRPWFRSGLPRQIYQPQRLLPGTRRGIFRCRMTHVKGVRCLKTLPLIYTKTALSTCPEILEKRWSLPRTCCPLVPDHVAALGNGCIQHHSRATRRGPAVQHTTRSLGVKALLRGSRLLRAAASRSRGVSLNYPSEVTHQLASELATWRSAKTARFVTSHPASCLKSGSLVTTLAFHHSDPGSIPGGSIPGFSRVGIVLDDAACRRGFSGYSSFPRPFIAAPLHPRVSFNVMSGDDGHLRVPAGEPVTRPDFTPHSIGVITSSWSWQGTCQRTGLRGPRRASPAVMVTFRGRGGGEESNEAGATTI